MQVCWRVIAGGHDALLLLDTVQVTCCAVPCYAVLCVNQATTRIKYVTDGLLLREMMDDPLLTKYRWAWAKGPLQP